MEIKGITSDQFYTIVRHVSATMYDNNVTCNDPQPRPLNRAGLRFNQRVIVLSSRGAGARRSWSGRRMPCACWHVFRDVVRATLAAHPGATFRTRMAYYTSDNFESTYPATGYVNVGSLMQPAYMPNLCDCPTDARVDGGRGRCLLPRTDEEEGQHYYLPILPSVSGTDLAPAIPGNWAAERDQALAIAAGECAWCGTATLGDVFAWCNPECQSLWQDKYGAGLARTV